MRKLILLVILLACFIVPHVEAKLIIEGAKTVYTGGVNELTEGPEAPDAPALNDLWRNTDTNKLYHWDGDSWELNNRTYTIEEALENIRAEVENIPVPATERVVQSLIDIVEELYEAQR